MDLGKWDGEAWEEAIGVEMVAFRPCARLICSTNGSAFYPSYAHTINKALSQPRGELICAASARARTQVSSFMPLFITIITRREEASGRRLHVAPRCPSPESQVFIGCHFAGGPAGVLTLNRPSPYSAPALHLLSHFIRFSSHVPLCPFNFLTLRLFCYVTVVFVRAVLKATLCRLSI